MIEIVMDVIFAAIISLMIAYVPVLLYMMLKAKPFDQTHSHLRTAGIIFFVSLVSFSALFIHGSLANKKELQSTEQKRPFQKSPGR